MTKKSKDSTTAKTEPEGKTEASPVKEVNASKRGKKKRPYPIESFEESIEFCKTLYHLGAGDKVRRLTLFDKLGKSPDSGPSRMLIITANKYGLIKGNAQSEFLELSPNGLKAVSDEIPKDAAFKAKFELCITQIDIYNFLYTKYAGSKLPSFAVIYDLLKDQFKDKGLDDQDTHAIVETFIVNIKYLGLLQLISGAERIITIEHALESIPSVSIPTVTTITKTDSKTIDLIEVDATSQIGKVYDSYDNICFYITPIGQEDSEHRMHSNLFLESIITPVIEQFGLKVIRADGIDKPGTITNQIIEYIFKSKLVVADLSFHNPNVFMN